MLFYIYKWTNVFTVFNLFASSHITPQAKQTFKEHEGDVMSLSVLPSVDVNMFISGSCDSLAKVWDIRTGKNIAFFSVLFACCVLGGRKVLKLFQNLSSIQVLVHL